MAGRPFFSLLCRSRHRLLLCAFGGAAGAMKGRLLFRKKGRRQGEPERADERQGKKMFHRGFLRAGQKTKTQGRSCSERSPHRRRRFESESAADRSCSMLRLLPDHLRPEHRSGFRSKVIRSSMARQGALPAPLRGLPKEWGEIDAVWSLVRGEGSRV